MKYKKRGRPALKLIECDKGTIELRIKKQLGATTEIIDLILEKELITQQQHLAALHFRWLYTLKFGIKSLTSAYNNTYAEISYLHSESWREEREAEYNSILNILKNINADKLLLGICIFNKVPAFLNFNKKHMMINKEFRTFIKALESLNAEWPNSFAKNQLGLTK